MHHYLIESICPPLLEPLPVPLNMLIISACDCSYSIFIYIYLCTWLHRVLVVARGILVPQPGIEPVPQHYSSILGWRIPWAVSSTGSQSRTQLSGFHFPWHCKVDSYRWTSRDFPHSCLKPALNKNTNRT